MDNSNNNSLTTGEPKSGKKKRSKRKYSTEKSEKTFFAKLKNWWPFSRVSGRIISVYLLTIVIGGFLLSIPGVVKEESNFWNFITGMFTASSAFSDTGITMIQTNTGYSFFGQFLILLLIQMGGIGILTVKIVFLVFLNKKISLDDQSVANTERGSNSLANTVEMIKDAFFFLLSVEIIGAFILFFGFYFTPMSKSYLQENPNTTTNPYHNFGTSLWASIFHSVSAVNNAGFDILSGNSLQPYNQDDSRGYILQFTFLAQWIIGGLGYPTYHDIKRKFRARKLGKTVKFSLFTKLNFIVYVTLFILGPVLVFLSEYLTIENSAILLNKDSNGEHSEKIWKPAYVWIIDILFNVSSCRNAGFASVDINNFTAGSKFILSIWMFIGAAPSSTAGGIRTTTLAICFIAIFSIMRNKSSTEAFKKRIPDETVKRSFAVVLLSFMIVLVSIYVVYLDSNEMLFNTDDSKNTESTIIKLIVYVCSAFGTVGFQPFTNGQIIQMGVISKIMLVITMFIGQLGISNTLLAFVKPKNKQNYGYLEEDVTIG